MTERTRAAYLAAFDLAQRLEYPEIDRLEQNTGFAIARHRLNAAARVLACPLKVNPPHWQHGRVVYAMVRKVLVSGIDGLLLDIGTAKGFSATMMASALADAGVERRLVSVDIVGPEERVERNSIAELEHGPLTIREYVSRFWPIGTGCEIGCEWYGGGSQPLLRRLKADGCKVALAFIDGKHTTQAVHAEAEIIREMQDRGAVIVFDDLQLPQVANAVRDLAGYTEQYVTAGPRRYAIATRL